MRTERDEYYYAIERSLSQRSEELTNQLLRINAEREQVVHQLHEVTVAYRVIEELRKSKT